MREPQNKTKIFETKENTSDDKNNSLVTEKKSKRKKTSYHSIFDQASDAIIITDFDGNFIDFNDSLCRMSGYTKKELLQLNIRDLIEPDQLKKRPMNFHRVAVGEQVHSERLMMNKNGDMLHIEANVKKFGDDMQLAILRDVTEMRKAQKMVELSEARFRGAFEHSAIGMAIVSLEGKWLKVNNELCNMTGYTKEELFVQHCLDISHPDDLNKDLHFFQQLMDGEIEFYRIKQRYIHKDGSIIWINLNTSLIKDSLDQPLYFVSQIENITNRKESEEALKKSEANMQAVFDTTDTAYALINTDLRVISYNKYAADFVRTEVGVSGKAGDHLSKFILDERKPVIEPLLPEVLTGRHINYEAGYPQPDGSVHWYYVRLYPITGIEKEVFGLMVAIDNITNRKQEELNKEKTANELISRNKDLEKFAHILSHNVRSHVTRLMGLTNLLTEFDINEEENNMLISGVSQSVNELDEVVRNLNDLLQYKEDICKN